MFAVNNGKTQKENRTSRIRAQKQKHTHIHVRGRTHTHRERVTTQITIQMVCLDENEFSRLLSIVWHGS